MSQTSRFFYPISSFSTNPLGDAAAQIAQATGVSVDTITAAFAANSNAEVTAWNDPRKTTVGNGGVGTGRWQWCAAYRILTGTDDVEIHYAFSQGLNVISLGGGIQAPPPSFSGMNMLASPVLNSGMGDPTTGAAGGTNFLIKRISPTNISTICADLVSYTQALAATSGGNFKYYTDPVTSLVNGSGMWKMCGVAANASGTLCIVETGGCSLSSIGFGPAIPPPASFSSFTQLHSIWG